MDQFMTKAAVALGSPGQLEFLKHLSSFEIVMCIFKAIVKYQVEDEALGFLVDLYIRHAPFTNIK